MMKTEIADFLREKLPEDWKVFHKDTGWSEAVIVVRPPKILAQFNVIVNRGTYEVVCMCLSDDNKKCMYHTPSDVVSHILARQDHSCPPWPG